MILDTNNSSVFNLRYKLVIVAKKTRYLECEGCLHKIKEMFLKIGFNYGISLEEITNRDTAIIIEFKAKPNVEISKFVNTYKSSTSRRIKKELERGEEVKEVWRKGYLLLTIGEYGLEVIDEYILGVNK